MTNKLIGIWLVLYGSLSLVETKVPEWIVPVTACIIGLAALVGNEWLTKKNP